MAIWGTTSWGGGTYDPAPVVVEVGPAAAEGVAEVSAALGYVQDVAATADATAHTSGALSADTGLSAAAETTASTTAALSADTGLSSAVVSDAQVTADAERAPGLSATGAGTGSGAGTVTLHVAAVLLDASAQGAASATGLSGYLQDLTAVADASASTTAALARHVPLTADSAASGLGAATLSASIPVAAASSGASTSTAAAARTVPVAASGVAHSSAAAALAVEISLSGTSASQAEVVAALARTVPVTASGTASSSAAASFVLAVAVASSAVAAAAVTAEMGRTVPLSADAEGQAAVASEVSQVLLFAASSAGLSSSSASLAVEIPLSADATGLAAVASEVSRVLRLQAFAEALATAESVLAVSAQASALADGTASASTTLTLSQGLSAQATSSADTTATLDLSLPLAAQSDGLAVLDTSLTLSQDLTASVTGTPSVTGALDQRLDLSAQAVAASAASGTLDLRADLTASVAGTSAATAALSPDRTLSAQSAAGSAVTASLDLRADLTASVAAGSASVASLTLDQGLSAASAAGSTVSALLVVPVEAHASGAASSSASAVLTRDRAFDAEVSAGASASATTQTVLGLAAALASSATASGALDQSLTFDAVVSSEATVLASVVLSSVFSAQTASTADVTADLIAVRVEAFSASTVAAATASAAVARTSGLAALTAGSASFTVVAPVQALPLTAALTGRATVRGVFVTARPSYAQRVAADGATGLWRFDDPASGGTFTGDTFQNSLSDLPSALPVLTASRAGVAVQQIPGPKGSTGLSVPALLAASSVRYTVPVPALAKTAPFTVEGYVRVDGTSGSSEMFRLGVPNSTNVVGAHYANDTTVVVGALTAGGAFNETGGTVANRAVAGWVHYALVVSRSEAGTATLYRNGVQVVQRSIDTLQVTAQFTLHFDSLRGAGTTRSQYAEVAYYPNLQTPAQIQARIAVPGQTSVGMGTASASGTAAVSGSLRARPALAASVAGSSAVSLITHARDLSANSTAGASASAAPPHFRLFASVAATSTVRGVFVTTPLTYAQRVEADGATGHWRFDDPVNASNVYTSSNHANVLVGKPDALGSLSSSRGGVFGTKIPGPKGRNALYSGPLVWNFTNRNWQVFTGGTTSFTMEVWFRLPPGAGESEILAAGTSVTLFAQNQTTVFMRTRRASGSVEATGHTVSLAAAWSLFTITVSGTTATLYRNGVQVGVPLTGSGFAGALNVLGLHYTPLDVTSGTSGTGAVEYAEAAYYPNVHTALQIQRRVNAPGDFFPAGLTSGGTAGTATVSGSLRNRADLTVAVPGTSDAYLITNARDLRASSAAQATAQAAEASRLALRAVASTAGSATASALRMGAERPFAGTSAGATAAAASLPRVLVFSGDSAGTSVNYAQSLFPVALVAQRIDGAARLVANLYLGPRARAATFSQRVVANGAAGYWRFDDDPLVSPFRTYPGTPTTLGPLALSGASFPGPGPRGKYAVRTDGNGTPRIGLSQSDGFAVGFWVRVPDYLSMPLKSFTGLVGSSGWALMLRRESTGAFNWVLGHDRTGGMADVFRTLPASPTEWTWVWARYSTTPLADAGALFSFAGNGSVSGGGDYTVSPDTYLNVTYGTHAGGLPTPFTRVTVAREIANVVRYDRNYTEISNHANYLTDNDDFVFFVNITGKATAQARLGYLQHLDAASSGASDAYLITFAQPLYAVDTAGVATVSGSLDRRLDSLRATPHGSAVSAAALDRSRRITASSAGAASASVPVLGAERPFTGSSSGEAAVVGGGISPVFLTTSSAGSATAATYFGAASYPQVVLSDRPLAYWRFRNTDVWSNNEVELAKGTFPSYPTGGSGTRVAPVMEPFGTSTALVSSPGAVFDSGRALRFPAVQGHWFASVTGLSFQPTTTVELWMRFEGAVTADTPLAGFNATASGISLYLNSQKRLQFRQAIPGAAGTGANSVVVTTSFVPEPDVWYHVVASQTLLEENPSSVFSLYINGEPLIENNPGSTNSGPVPRAAATQFYLHTTNSGPGLSGAVTFSEVAIYNTALSRARALKHYQANRQPTNFAGTVAGRATTSSTVALTSALRATVPAAASVSATGISPVLLSAEVQGAAHAEARAVIRAVLSARVSGAATGEVPLLASTSTLSSYDTAGAASVAATPLRLRFVSSTVQGRGQVFADTTNFIRRGLTAASAAQATVSATGVHPVYVTASSAGSSTAATALRLLTFFGVTRADGASATSSVVSPRRGLRVSINTLARVTGSVDLSLFLAPAAITAGRATVALVAGVTRRLAAVAAGAATATASTRLTLRLAAASSGKATLVADLDARPGLQVYIQGFGATRVGAPQVEIALAATASGTSAGSARLSRALASAYASASGTTAVSVGQILRSFGLDASSSSAATATSDVVLAPSLSVSSAGHADLAAAVRVAVALSAVSSGRTQVSAYLASTVALSASAAAFATAATSVALAPRLSVEVAGSSTAASAVQRTRPFTAESAGTSTTDSRAASTVELSAKSRGKTTRPQAIPGGFQDGPGVEGSLSLSPSRLSADSAARARVTADAAVVPRLSAQTSGTSTASASTAVALQISAAASGLAAVEITLPVTVELSAKSRGKSTRPQAIPGGFQDGPGVEGDLSLSPSRLSAESVARAQVEADLAREEREEAAFAALASGESTTEAALQASRDVAASADAAATVTVAGFSVLAARSDGFARAAQSPGEVFLLEETTLTARSSLFAAPLDAPADVVQAEIVLRVVSRLYEGETPAPDVVLAGDLTLQSASSLSADAEVDDLSSGFVQEPEDVFLDFTELQATSTLRTERPEVDPDAADPRRITLAATSSLVVRADTVSSGVVTLVASSRLTVDAPRSGVAYLRAQSQMLLGQVRATNLARARLVAASRLISWADSDLAALQVLRASSSAPAPRQAARQAARRTAVAPTGPGMAVLLALDPMPPIIGVVDRARDTQARTPAAHRVDHEVPAEVMSEDQWPSSLRQVDGGWYVHGPARVVNQNQALGATYPIRGYVLAPGLTPSWVPLAQTPTEVLL